MAAGQIEKVQVMLQAFTQGFSKSLDRAQTQLKRAGKNMREFGQVMQMPMEGFKKMNENARQMTTTGGRFANGMRMMTHGMRGFRMEMLGVMFFGMAMQRMFMGFLHPVMEAFGVMDLFRVMLLTLFLPIMEAIFPYMLSMMEWFMNLPKSVKKAIGVIVIVGAALGALLMIFGQLFLGIGSIILAWPTMMSIMSTIGTILVPIIAIVMGIIDIFANWGRSTRKVVRGILTVIAGVAAIIAIVMGAPALLVAAIVIAVIAIIRVVVKYWDNIKQAFSDGWAWVKRTSLSAFNWLKDKFSAAGRWVKDIFSFGEGGGGTSGTSTKRGKRDFIWRAGQGATSISPHDTVVGFEGKAPNFGGRDAGSNITNNFYGFTKEDLNRDLDDRDRRIVDEIRRIVKQ